MNPTPSLPFAVRRLASWAVVLGAAVASPAQGRTWIVDQNGGPGSHFTDLPPAVAQAADGDRLIVRQGSYTGFSTGKALTVLGEGSVAVSRFSFPVPGSPVVEITGPTAGRAFVMRNVAVSVNTSNSWGVVLSGVSGRVHLEDVDVDASGAGTTTAAALGAIQCAAVTITGGRVIGHPAVLVGDSLVAITGTDVIGGAGSWSPRMPLRAREGVYVIRSTLLLSRSDVSGGSGSPVFPDGAAAITAHDTDLTVTGDATTVVRAGTYWNGTPAPAIAATGGVVTADTRMTIGGTNGGPPIGGTAAVVRRRVASMWARGARLSGTVTAELVSPANEPIHVVASVPGTPIATPWGVAWIDPGFYVPLFAGTQDPSGRFGVAFAVPPNPALRGLTLVFQAAHFHVAAGLLELASPAVAVIG